MLSATECVAIVDAVERIESEYGGGPCPQSPAEDLHTFVELLLTEYAGDAGRRIHTARSRNDQVATLIRMYAAESGRALIRALARLTRVACLRAIDWSGLPMPFMTHTQFAAPGSTGAWALRYACAFDRARRHLEFLVREWWRFCPLGSGAAAGSSIAIDRRIQATDLGFNGPSLSALDSTSTRDECVELLAVAVQIGLHLQALATDVILFSQTPLAWTRYPREFATGSSMMPNKLNPDAMELLRGECNALFAAHAEVVTTLKGLPSGYNRDLQCIKPVLKRGVEALLRSLEMTTEFLAVLDFDAEALQDALRLGHVDATLRMEERVRRGMPLRAAHHETAEELASLPIPEQVDGGAWIAGYRTLGAASPAETRRVAQALLAEVPAEENGEYLIANG